mgnify:CR=1 FL=1
MPTKLRRNGIVFCIIIFVIGASVASASHNEPSLNSQQLVRGNTLYVGGAGPGNYTTIQDAIDDASDGDTIVVYPGIYYEHQVLINRRSDHQVQAQN